MKTALAWTILWGAAAVAAAQVTPEATSPHKLSVSGTLDYSARYSQIADVYSSGQSNEQRALLSGDLGYRNDRERSPFSVTLGAGYSWSLSGAGYGNGPYENLLLAQGFVARSWSLNLSDNVGYRKQSPTTGFSGVAGTGEPIGQPNPAPSTSESVFTLNTVTINNSANVGYTHRLAGSLSTTLGGGSELLRYPNGNGNDTNTAMANAGLTERLSARNSLMEQYEFSYYTYTASSLSFESNTGLFGWDRRWTRRISSSVSVGPQWISSSESSMIPASIRLYVDANASDTFRSGSLALDYLRGSNGGSGYFFGAENDQASAAFNREFRNKLTIELAGGYRRTSPLTSVGVTNGKYGAAQATKRLGRDFTVYASYTATVQSSSAQLPANALNQLWQTISFGVGYTPLPIHMRH